MSSRNVLSRLFLAIWGGIDGVRKILHLLLLLVLFIGFAGLMSGAPGILPSQAALVVQPSALWSNSWRAILTILRWRN